MRNYRMAQEIKTTQAEAVEILTRLDEMGLTQRDLADILELDENKVSKVRSGVRQFKAGEVLRANYWLDEQAELRAAMGSGDKEANSTLAYLPVEILPSYAGMGGGGTGDGELEHALIPRRMIEDELRAKPSDLLLIETRGESMLPDFQHGDQILIDRRDCNPVQPGAFALWDGDGYVVKLVERIPHQRGRYRVFSANGRFSPYEVDESDIKIMGRPVWFGRRL